MDLVTHSLTPQTYRLSGRLTFKDNESFSQAVAEMAGRPGRDVIFDLADLEFVDSFGIGLFLVASETLVTAGKRLVILNPQGSVSRLFRLAKLDSILHIEDDGAPAPKKPDEAAGLREGLNVGTISEPTPGHFLIELSGRFSFAEQPKFQPILDMALSPACLLLTLDLADLDFMDSAGLSMLLVANEALQDHDGRMELLAPQGRVAQLLAMAAVDSVVSIIAHPTP